MIRKIKDEKGSSSLFFLILLPVTILLLFLIFENVKLRRDEVDFVRACESGLDLTLADFDRKLWHEFGLWGVESSLINQHNDELQGNLINPVHSSSINLIATANLDETENLRKQILRHMSIRGPFLITDELISKFSELKLLGNSISNNSVWSKISESKNFLDPEKILDDPDSISGDADSLGIKIPEEDEEKLADLSDSEMNSLTDSAMGILGDIIDGTKEMIIPFYKTSGNEIPANPLSPNSLHSIAGFADNFLTNYDLPVISRIQIQEYMVNYYTMQCTDLELNGEQIKLQTPDGRLHSELTAVGRRNEVEQIIFNIDDPDKAVSTANGVIRGICFGYHLINNYYDQVKQSIYLAEATATSTLIALASLGHIILEPQPLVYLFMLTDSLKEAIADTNELLEGKEVIFKIQDLQIELNYRDFMRAFALFNSEQNLLTRINNMRKKTITGNYITGIKLDAHFGKSNIQMSREFSDYVEED